MVIRNLSTYTPFYKGKHLLTTFNNQYKIATRLNYLKHQVPTLFGPLGTALTKT